MGTSGFTLKDKPRAARPPVFSVACELPSQRQLPFRRHSAARFPEVVIGDGTMVRVRTVQRIPAEDALKPWPHRGWIHPRDPDFQTKVAVILDLYQGVWQGHRLGPNNLVVGADEKPGIPARRHRVQPPWPRRLGRVESDYQGSGALQQLCAWDVQRGLPWGRCAAKTGIAAFGLLWEQVMSQDPYRSARRVFRLVDNGSSHRVRKAIDRLQNQYPNLIRGTRRFTSPDATRRKFTSGRSSARCSPRLRPTASWNWNDASSPSKHAAALGPAPSPGASPVLSSSVASKSLQRDP